MDLLDWCWDQIMDNPCAARQGDAIDPSLLADLSPVELELAQGVDAAIWDQVEDGMLQIARVTLHLQDDAERKSA